MATLTTIAHIQSAFPTKFGIPRQSGLVPHLHASIVFEPPYRNPEALRGFSEVKQREWSPTVRPPRLGGNTRMGVFATRSPYRPNTIGLSSVQIERIALQTDAGPVIHVLGADLLDGTPIYDIKPYLPYTDSHPEATAGFVDEHREAPLQVHMDDHLLAGLPPGEEASLRGVLAQDPRPAYQHDPERVYGMAYRGLEVKFSVTGKVLTVLEIRKTSRRILP